MYTSGVMMVKRLLGVRVCATLLFVLIYSVSLSYSTDPRDEQTKNASFSSSAANLFYHGTLTEKQKLSSVTIEFNSTVIDTKNRTTVNSIYRNVHKAILKILNRRESNMTTIPPSTSLVETTSTSTTPFRPTPQTVVPAKKRKKRVQNKLEEYETEDLRFVEIDPEIDENGILRISLLLAGKGLDDQDYGTILFKAVNDANETGLLDTVAGVPVVMIYRGLPANGTMSPQNSKILIWLLLVILFVILLLVVIGGFIIYWKKRSNKRQLKITEPKEMS